MTVVRIDRHDLKLTRRLQRAAWTSRRDEMSYHRTGFLLKITRRCWLWVFFDAPAELEGGGYRRPRWTRPNPRFAVWRP